RPDSATPPVKPEVRTTLPEFLRQLEARHAAGHDDLAELGIDWFAVRAWWRKPEARERVRRGGNVGTSRLVRTISRRRSLTRICLRLRRREKPRENDAPSLHSRKLMMRAKCVSQRAVLQINNTIGESAPAEFRS